MGEKKPFFYGWIIAISCFILLSFGMGAITVFGLFMPEIIKTTGATVTVIVLIPTIGCIVAFFANYFLIGKIIQKLGAKWSLLIFGLGLSIQLLIFSVATEIWQLYVAGALAGIGTGFIIASSSIILTRWFKEKRETVIGVVFSGISFGGVVLLPLAGRFIARFGWQDATLYLSIILMIIQVVVAGLFIKESPEKMGLKPYGYKENEVEAATQKVYGVDAAKARKSSSYWFLLIGSICIGFTIPGFTTYAASYWGSQGMSAIDTSTYMGVFSLVGGFGILLSGFLTQKFGTKFFLIYTTITFIIGIFVSLITVQTAMVILSVVLVGIATPLYYNTPSLTTIDAFGNRDYDKLIGPFQGATLLGAAGTYIISASIVDLTGSYVPSFLLFCIVGALGFILLLCGLKLAPVKKMISADSKEIGA